MTLPFCSDIVNIDICKAHAWRLLPGLTNSANLPWREVTCEDFAKNSLWSQNRYSTSSPTLSDSEVRRLWCWCPRIFGRRHLRSKRAWKMFTLYWRYWCRFYEEKQFVVNFGTWTMNQNALWQLKSPQTKPKPLASKMAAVKKVGQKK